MQRIGHALNWPCFRCGGLKSFAAAGLLFSAATSLACADETRGTPEDWAIHAQATFVEQYHPAFRSPYRGANSFDPGSRGDETVDATLYLGARLWDGAEAWANGEIDQGFGLSNTLGIAGFPNAEGSKVGNAAPYPKVHRLFLP